MNDVPEPSTPITPEDVHAYLAAGDCRKRLTAGQATFYAERHGAYVRRWLVNGSRPFSYARGER